MMFTAKLALYGNTYPINSPIASNQWSFNPSTNLAQPNVITGGETVEFLQFSDTSASG